MKISNRVMGFLLLLSIIGVFYIFYQVFFKIKLTNLEINSNIGNYSGSLENIKFSKDFYCEEKKCIISNIPPFEYKLNINKQNYKSYGNNINLFKVNKLDISLDKNIILKKLNEKQLSKREKILELSKNKLNFGNNNIIYINILGTKKYVYFKNNNKLYFYNLDNNSFFDISFKLKINYIKKINNNKLLINGEVGSFILNILTKKLEYFSLFSDFVFEGNNYIGVINNDDIVRKKNFDLANISGNIIIYFNTETKEKVILKNINNKINKIYKIEEKIFLEDNIGNKFELKGF